jgi:nucleotide-binding universal stress UspA family protein
MAVSLTIGRRVVFSLIRWTNDYFVSEFPVITMILLIMVVMALTTQLIGVNTVLGAFVAGILIGESPILTRHIDEQLRGLIVALFMPVFFSLAGLNADLSILKTPALAALAVGLIAIASVGKFLGAFIGGKIGGLSRAESLALGCGMNARGSTEVIVASIGLSVGVLNQNLFTLIVTMAIVTTMAMPTMLRWALKRLPLSNKERQRLEREELDAKSFVPNLERLLLAADSSPNGQFASQLAGIIAGSGGKPTTVVDMTMDSHSRVGANADAEPAEAATASDADPKQQVKSAARSVKTLEAHPDEEKPGDAHVITRREEPRGPDAIAGEARKGYDLLVIGIAKTRNSDGGFSEDLFQLSQGFDGPLAVVDTREPRRGQQRPQYRKILIPVTGSEVSRRAAEVGVALARGSDAEVTALYVTRGNGAGNTDKSKSGNRKRALRRNEQAVLKDIGALGDRYEVNVRSTTRVNAAPDEAILKEAKRGYDLIVLGVSRRPGETLFFGNTAAAVLEHSATSNLFVAS